jgi:acetoin utilization deacetylase AcuC-like enzyme
MSRTALLYHPYFLEHDAGPGHPECPSRLTAIMERLDGSQVLGQLLLLTPPPASRETIGLVHSPAHVDRMARLSSRGGLVPETPDTVVSPATYQAALLAAGAVQQAVDAVMEGRAANGFCIVRPPGHHAERDQAMGFCYFNNIAIAARYLQSRHGVGRVAILDWDVHHGNGTQHSFEDDPSVFFFSIHEYSSYFFPGTGAHHEMGRGPGYGTTLNAPVPPGFGDAEYLRIFRDQLRPAIDRFRPEFILLSAGFDAHWADPLGHIELTEHGFAALTAEVLAMAREHCQGRLVSTLEGGYDFAATAASVEAHLQVLMG